MQGMSNPWSGSGFIEIDVDQVVQALLVATLSLTAIMLLAGIIEALTVGGRERPKYVRIAIDSAICTIVVASVTLSMHPLERIPQWFFESLLFLSVSILVELIPIIVVDDVREAFIREIPMLSDFIEALEEPAIITGGSGGRHSSLRSMDLGLRDWPASNVEIAQPVERDRAGICDAGAEAQTVAVSQETVTDPEYERYREWILKCGLPEWSRLSYEEFSEIRDVVDEVLDRRAFGMARSKLGIRELSLLAKIDSRENVNRLKRKYRIAFEKLRRFKLVSNRGRLMPRGVRLVKALKRRKLMDTLKLHPA